MGPEVNRRRHHRHQKDLLWASLCGCSFPIPVNLYYSLWNYSLYRIRIGLRMQQRRSRQRAATAEELFGQVLREVRKTRSLSQEELAFESGYHPTYVGQLERGKKSPSLRAIIRLAKALDTPGSELLRRVETLTASDG
jgi:DNA-binding XRE family transcriptional regulator